MTRNIPIIFFIAVLFIGCTVFSPYRNAAKKMNQLKVGMTKDEVVVILGEPITTSAKDEVEYLNYSLRADPYCVEIVNGKVNSFGRVFPDSTIRIGIDKKETIKQDANIKTEEKPDLYKELHKLKELKEQGLLTEEEFELKKKEILKKY